MEFPPAECPNGHRLGSGTHTVGWVGCSGEHPGGHRTWCCNQCHGVICGPPLGDACTVIDGPAPESNRYTGTAKGIPDTQNRR
jgi:hypothetical protein